MRHTHHPRSCILAAASALLIASGSLACDVLREAPAANPIVQRAARLQRLAELANGGALGCGIGGSMVVHTNGADVGLDPAPMDAQKVFGNEIYLRELHALLAAREMDVTRGEGPMAGEMDDLCYVTLVLCARVGDPSSVMLMVPLLDDPNETISTWAAISLMQMGAEHEDARETINAFGLPATAVRAARTRGVEAPEWIRVIPEQPPIRCGLQAPPKCILIEECG